MFGEVRVATRSIADPLGRIPERVAVKTIDKAKVEDMNDITREIELTSRVDHVNIVRTYEVFDEPERIWLVMDHCPGGDLFDRIVAMGSFTEQDAASVMRQLCAALAHLHERRIYHRDVKADNILLIDAADPAMRIKLADFGVARHCPDDERMMTACGTPFYVAPEVIAGDGYTGGGADCWSAGVICYMMLCGVPPFAEEDLSLLFAKILTAAYTFPTPNVTSSAAIDAVRQLLTVAPSARMAAAAFPACEWAKSATAEAQLDVASGLSKLGAMRRAGHKVVMLQRVGLLQKA